MSIIDELLVLLDDQNAYNINEVRKNLNNRTLQTISSTLGRLEAKGWVKSSKKDKVSYFKITSHGSKYITDVLNEIKKRPAGKWNSSWQIVVFNIPEKQRSRRDHFRQSIEKLGYGRIEDSLWLSPNNQSEALDQIIHRLKIENNVTIINTGKLTTEDQDKIKNKFQWPWTKLNENYKIFINNCKRFLGSKKTIFSARLLVFEYAKILIGDPNFPNELTPKGYSGEKAWAIYQKIRPYCYKK